MGEDEELCFQCGSPNVTESIEEQSFLYGSPGSQVTLVATIPVFTCQDCGFGTFDERGEAARSNAVFEYLASKKK